MKIDSLNIDIPDEYNLIGITGNAASGKDYVAQQISERGYVHTSSSDILREEIKNRGQTPNREIQTQIANELREVYGVDTLVKAALIRAIEASKNTAQRGAVISGLYAPGEAVFIQNLGGRIVEVSASAEDDLQVRFERLRKRQDGSRDDIDYTAFKASFLRENNGIHPHQANVSEVAHLANFHIINDGNAEKLKEQIDNMLKG